MRKNSSVSNGDGSGGDTPACPPGNRPSQNRPFARHPLVIAHRGASGEAPENTLEAIRLATEKYGVDLIEIDLRLSRDGIPIVIHDSILERTTNGKGRVEAHSLAELKALDAGYGFDPEGKGAFPFRGKGIRIPTLEEVLREFPASGFCLEMKEKKVEAVEKIFDPIRRIRRPGPILIGSFHGKVAREARRQASPSIESFFSRDEVVRAYFAFRLGFRKFSPPAVYASLPPAEGKIRLDRPNWIQFLHESGVRVFYWTVNDPREMETLMKRGADGILTDYPDRLNRVLGR